MVTVNEENLLERVIKLESDVSNLKDNLEKNNKNITDFTAKLHGQEVYQARIESKIDQLSLEIKRFREDSLEDRKVQMNRLKKIEEERATEKSKPGDTWDKIKVGVLTAMATGVCLAAMYFLLNNIKF